MIKNLKQMRLVMDIIILSKQSAFLKEKRGGTIRITAQFYIDHEVNIPYDLNYPLSSYIYQCIGLANAELGDWLHNEGLAYRGKSYKPLVFSRLHFERRRNKSTHMEVKGLCGLTIDSIQPEIIQHLIQGMWKKGYLQLLDVKIPLMDVKMKAAHSFVETMSYKLLSPVVVPVQIDKGLHFCHPLESQFYDSLRQSISNWYNLKWQEELPREVSIQISLLQPEFFQLKKAAVLTQYKEKKVKGYLASIQVQAPPKVQQVIYESGLGSYNSQGFGCVEVIQEEKK
ncbi:CRISPR-associated endoribonuclease Cas6 [Marininema halotolerans]|uniref:CRISPR-associated endoribonuclease Cas6 n=1 Tax=Marininema halotolerans TaxID=1155944 RepID=A0A1I6UT67_9BACL|nr:CRISPR-associated endoribonuclease Cas6 [Marininema halotolerans]SFT04547.1 CRISPR-associated endoribonuclease Cas6 [Marininema halotolerans]